MGAAHEYTSFQLEEGAHQQPPAAECDLFAFLGSWPVLILSAALPAAWLFYLFQTDCQVPHYSAAIDHVAGLDVTTDLGHASNLDLEFNLTVSVASHGLWVSRYLDVGMYVVVSYRDVSLATTATVTRKICAGPGKTIEQPLVAKGEGVIVAGSMLDSLSMDLRSGVPVFDVSLHRPKPWKEVWSCGPTLVGDAGTLRTECISM